MSEDGCDFYRQHGVASFKLLEDRMKEAIASGDEARALDLAMLLVEVEEAAAAATTSRHGPT